MTVKIELELTDNDILAACQTRIRNMFDGSGTHFNCCVLWDCCELLKIEYMRDTEVGKFINLFHTVDFADIEESQFQKLKKVCFALVGLEIKTRPYPEKEYTIEDIELMPKSMQFEVRVSGRRVYLVESLPTCYHEFEIVQNPEL